MNIKSLGFSDSNNFHRAAELWRKMQLHKVVWNNYSLLINNIDKVELLFIREKTIESEYCGEEGLLGAECNRFHYTPQQYLCLDGMPLVKICSPKDLNHIKDYMDKQNYEEREIDRKQSWKKFSNRDNRKHYSTVIPKKIEKDFDEWNTNSYVQNSIKNIDDEWGKLNEE
tara:strand:+ start:1304 stop:1813 length:510 start_codon:yes stop_codon:yes gene_type:complete